MYGRELARIVHHQHEAEAARFTVFQALTAAGIADEILRFKEFGRGERLIQIGLHPAMMLITDDSDAVVRPRGDRRDQRAGTVPFHSPAPDE